MSGILVDTSVWVDHFRQPNAALMALLERDMALVHPMIVGEIACGTPPDRHNTLLDLETLNKTQQASVHEVMGFIDRHVLYGKGCGLVDLTLLASVLMTPSAKLWTLDKRLKGLADRFDVAYHPAVH